MFSKRLQDAIELSGFVCPEQLIHIFIGGSELHGAKVGATDDLDIYGVFVEPIECVVGFGERDHYVWSTASDDRRNGPEDIDVTLYSLRRWAELATKGNATALHFLFAQATAESTVTWRTVQDDANLFLSKRSAKQFIGFARNQKQRITGEKGHGAKGYRPEYIGRYGYDTKAAMHCLRLYFECIELMSVASITLPRPEKDLLIDVRNGSWSLEQFLVFANDLEARAEAAYMSSNLPDETNTEDISALVTKAHLKHWRVCVQ